MSAQGRSIQISSDRHLLDFPKSSQVGGNHLEFFFNNSTRVTPQRLARNQEQPSMIQGKPPFAGDKPPLASECHLVGMRGGVSAHSLPSSRAARSQFSFILMDCTTGRRGKINFLPIKYVWGKCPRWTPPHPTLFPRLLPWPPAAAGRPHTAVASNPAGSGGRR